MESDDIRTNLARLWVDALGPSGKALGRVPRWRLKNLTRTELLALPGIGPRKAQAVQAILDLAEWLYTAEWTLETPLDSPYKVYETFAPGLVYEPQEHFYVVLLDTRNRQRGKHLVSVGGWNCTVVDPREVFRLALCECAAGILLVHNHPSGDPAPSNQDLELTARLHEAGKLMQVPVLDHVIVAQGGYCSLRELGFFTR